MSLGFIDRVSTYKNRYLVTDESGNTSYVTLERADEPTKEGTPLNAATLNQLAALSDLDKLPNKHLWEKYKGNPSEYTFESVTDESLRSKITGVSGLPYASIVYGTGCTYSDGVFVLTGRATLNSPTTTNCSVLRGKWVVKTTNEDGDPIEVYNIPSDATFSQVTRTEGTFSMYHLIVSKATLNVANYFLGYAMDINKSTYPDGELHEDGYWYVYHKRFGDGSGDLSDSAVAAAVEDYLAENPPEGVTEERVNELINTAIGVSIGGEY